MEFISRKLTMTGSNPPAILSRTELMSDRRGSVDVVPFRSLFRVPPTPFPRPWSGVGAPPGDEPRGGPGAAPGGRLHDRPCRQTGPVRTGGVLDRDRHG